MRVEHVGRLDDVVVDAHEDQVVELHGLTITSACERVEDERTNGYSFPVIGAIEDGVPMSAAPRLVELEGCFNFRDLGGYETTDGRTVRWRRLFRSDGLHRLTEGDLEDLAELGLATVIDLRTVAEVEERGRYAAVRRRRLSPPRPLGDAATGRGDAQLGRAVLRGPALPRDVQRGGATSPRP